MYFYVQIIFMTSHCLQIKGQNTCGGCYFPGPFFILSTLFCIQEADMYGFQQWLLLISDFALDLTNRSNQVEGHRQETRRETRVRLGYLFFTFFSSLLQGLHAPLVLQKGYISFQLVLCSQISSGSSMVSSLSSSDNGAPPLLALGTWSTSLRFLLPSTSFK